MSRIHLRLLPLIIGSCGTLLAADGTGGPAVPPIGPGARSSPAAPGMSAARSAASYEVETLVVGPADTAAMATWASLAATGYHVVASVPSATGTAILYLERPSVGPHLQLPSVVEATPSIANAVRVKIQAERQALTAPRAPSLPPMQSPAAAAPQPADK